MTAFQANKGPEASGEPAHSNAVRSGAIRLAVVLFLLVSLSFLATGCRDTDVLTQKVIDAPGISEIDYSLDPVRTDVPESRNEDVANMYEGESEDQDRDQQEDIPDYSTDEPTEQEQTPQQIYDNSAPRSNGEATSGGEPDGSEGDALDDSSRSSDTGRGARGDDVSRDGASEHNEEPEEGDAVHSGQGQDAEEVKEPEEVPAGIEEDQQPEEDPGEQDAPRGRTITIDVPDSPSDDPQPDDGSPQPEQGDAGKGGGESWNPPSSGDGGGSGDDKPGETYSDGTYDTIPSAGKVAASGPYANIVQSLGGKGALAAAPQQWLDALPDAAYGNGSELADVKGIASWGDGTQMTDAAVREVIDSGAECVLTSNTYNSMTQDQADAFNKAGVNVLLMPDIGVHNAMDSDIVTAVDVVGELLKDAGSSIEFNAKSAAATWKSMHNRALASCLASNGGYTCIMWGNYYVENYLYQGSSEQASKNRISNYTSHRVYVDYIDLWSSGATRGTGNLMNNGDARSSFDLIDYYFQHSGAYRGTVAISQYSNFALENHPGIDKVRVSERSSQSIEIGDQVVTNEDYGLPTPVTFTRDKQIALKVAESASGSRDSIYNTGYDYTVWVMPSGPSGSWNDGTFESYLLAPWTYSVIRNHGTSDADGMVRDFYSTFYRCDNASDLIQGYGKEVNVTCAR